jgi:hemerythrin-like domain-containing protein
MTSRTTPGQVGPSVDTHDMVVIHRAFRRESRLLVSLIAAVPDGDMRRARQLAGHLRWYRLGLHNHHQGEDELIWPLLRARVNLEADVVLRMETQHERIAESLDEVMRALPAWQASASVPERDQLVAALMGHRAVLVEHLDDEEAHLLPVAGHHLNRAEWDVLGEHFLATTPQRQLLIFLGAVLEDADMSERASVLTAMPAMPRWIWRTAGQQIYARRMRHLRGRP